ncbi:MAG: sigma-70 family RNA polymerase sigma factor [Bryobacteraceae bacterium]|nr:sigma-70 family RNA polymerase sigma factor [Bryobacteraceae bacterium]
MPTKSLPPAALQRLVDSHRQFLAFLEKRVESREVAEDILQSAFVRGIERGGSLAGEESVVAWFYRVLRNAVIDHYRRRDSSEKVLRTWGREFLDRAAPEAATRDAVCDCITGLLEDLKPEYRDALRLVDLEGRSLAELAVSQGITPGNAAVRIHRARAALRRQVREACGACAEHGCFDCECGAEAARPGASTTNGGCEPAVR